MRQVINFHVKDHALAEDIYQDFFLSLVRDPVPPDIRNLNRYLYRALTHDIFDALRRIKHYQARIFRYSQMMNHAGATYPPEKTLMKSEEAEKMFSALDQHLSTHEAKAVKLRYKEGYKTKEVAHQMGVNPRSVSRYLSVGMKKIRETMNFSQKQG